MQIMYAVLNGATHRLGLPDPDKYVLPGIQWGRFDELLTPAYWRGQAWQHEQLGTYRDLRLGHTLAEEVTACLLGGFGMKAEIGIAAFSRLRERGLITSQSSQEVLERALTEPVIVYGNPRRYRFPRQKSRYLNACLKALDEFVEPADDRALRGALAQLPGIGLKTASWIVRNYRASDSVAIIDVHILRSGHQIHLFDETHKPHIHYLGLEERFLCFADAISVRASLLDSLMWDYMRRLSFALFGPIRRLVATQANYPTSIALRPSMAKPTGTRG